MKKYTNSQITHIIDEYVHHQRNREILKRHFVDGIVFEELAREFNLSVRRVKAITYKYEEEIFSHLK